MIFMSIQAEWYFGASNPILKNSNQKILQYPGCSCDPKKYVLKVNY